MRSDREGDLTHGVESIALHLGGCGTHIGPDK
jgi:hypothetical protein